MADKELPKKIVSKKISKLAKDINYIQKQIVPKPEIKKALITKKKLRKNKLNKILNQQDPRIIVKNSTTPKLKIKLN